MCPPSTRLLFLALGGLADTPQQCHSAPSLEGFVPVQLLPLNAPETELAEGQVGAGDWEEPAGTRSLPMPSHEPPGIVHNHWRKVIGGDACEGKTPVSCRLQLKGATKQPELWEREWCREEQQDLGLERFLWRLELARDIAKPLLKIHPKKRYF